MFFGRKRKRGGIRQRLSRPSIETTSDSTSQLADYLLAQFAWGIMSPQTIQKIARLALADCRTFKGSDCRLPDLEDLASAGSDGKHSNNIHRDIMKKFGEKSSLPQPMSVSMPFANNLGEQTQAILLPHEMFASIYRSYRDTWETSLVPSVDRLESFWKAVERHPIMLNHPNLTRADYKQRCVPLGLHGDEVPVTGRGKCWCKSMLTFQWVSLVGVGGTRDRMMWIWSVVEKYCVPGENGTLDVYWQVMRWSLHWLWMGVWPDRDWQGNVQYVCIGVFVYF